MAKSTLGKIVSRVGSSGGGKTYAKTRPGNYYGVLAIIIILGLTSVVYSRYQNQNRPTTTIASIVFPSANSVGYLATATNACGKVLHYLYPFRTPDPVFHVQATGVVQMTPTNAVHGSNISLSDFVKGYFGLVVSKNELGLPGPTGLVPAANKYVAGQTCPKGTKYFGKKAYPAIYYWQSLAQSKPTITTDPAKVKISSYLLITFGFEPKGVIPAQPSQATRTAMYAASLTPTTVPATLPTTSLPNGSSTTSSTTTTTIPKSSTTITTTAKG